MERKPAADLLTQFAAMDQKKPAVSQPEPRNTFLETVLSQPLSNATAPSFKSFQKTCHYSPKCAIPGAFVLDANNLEPGSKPYVHDGKDVYSLPTLPSMSDFPSTSYTIDCNNCGSSVPNEHYHCGICEGGDFDLCKSCIDAGVTCDGDEHWLLKRTIHHGVVIPSTTETLAPKKASKVVAEELVTPISHEQDNDDLTCNSCICRTYLRNRICTSTNHRIEMSARDFVTCQECPDFDLCFSCFQDGDHGHDPAHRFEAQYPEIVESRPDIKALCAPGRNVRHDAICDGCDEVSIPPAPCKLLGLTSEQSIYGIRNKCLSCPDFDYCSSCVGTAGEKHPGHRFAPISTPIKILRISKPTHRGIYCDGPLCSSYKGYITGDRYKCAVCHDTDFCANCEALPNHGHNATHPLIKMKLPIRHVSITTQHEDENGLKTGQLGDRPLAKHAATETNRSTSANAATQVQTVAEVSPSENAAPVDEVTKSNVEPLSAISKDLQAWYVSDSTPDGTKVAPNHFVSQSWTLRNPGPDAWPAGCAVYYIGGDDMRNLDVLHPSSVSAMAMANRSNVLASAVEPGKTGVFTVLLKSPVREGRAISYWRLKTPGGIAFGHKLWVDIEVRSTPVDLPIRSHILPATPIASETISEPKEEVHSESSSTMIFPKLDKESPRSSVHDVREVDAEEAPQAVMEPTTKTEEQELLEDVESLELEESDSDDEEFLTDEEYDILDASDEEFYSEGHPSTSK